MSTHNLCFEQKYEKYKNILSEHFHLSEVKFPIYLNRHVFVMGNKFSASTKKMFPRLQNAHVILCFCRILTIWTCYLSTNSTVTMIL